MEEKKVFLKENIGYILFLIILNFYILNNWYSFFNSVAIKQVSDFSFDGADFSIFANIGVFVENAMMFILNNVINILVTIVSSLVFSNVYLKKGKEFDKDSKLKDTRTITIFMSIISMAIIVVITRKFFILLFLPIYLIFPVIVYFVMRSRIRKAN